MHSRLQHELKVSIQLYPGQFTLMDRSLPDVDVQKNPKASIGY
jgi:hypothetical protein